MFSNWNIFFKSIKTKKYAKNLKFFLDEEYKNHIIYPPRHLIFNAFIQTPPCNIKVVIIGQDPYHQPNQATGMSFSVPPGVLLPFSLKNIYKEIELEYHCSMNYKNGDLTYLAKQGCLLLNTILTVRAHKPLSHNVDEYKFFIIDVLKYIDTLDQYIVFMLWGNYAKQFTKYITNKKRLILTCAHPSPLSALHGNWFHNGHFKKTNNYLKIKIGKIINWMNK